MTGDGERRRVRVAGRDGTEDLGAELARDAAGRMLACGRPPRPRHLSALSLAASADEGAFLDGFIGQVRSKDQVDVGTFETVPKPGLKGKIFHAARMLMWRVLRYQHERLFARQNTINAYLAEAIAFEREQARREIDALESRLATVEKVSAEAEARRAPEEKR
jgi:hypothetical protein